MPNIKFKLGMMIANLGAKLWDNGCSEYENMSPKGKLGVAIVYHALKFAGIKRPENAEFSN